MLLKRIPSLVTLIILLHSLQGTAQQNDDYKTWYKKGEKLFSLEHPNEQSDYVALKYFLDAANPALDKHDGKIAVGSLVKAATIKQTHKHFTESIDLYRRSIATNQLYFRDSS